MQQQRGQKPKLPLVQSTSRVLTNTNDPSAQQQATGGPNHDAKLLLSSIEAIERLTEKIDKIDRRTAQLVQDHETRHGSWLNRVANGNFGILFGLAGSAISVISVLSSLSLGLFKQLSVLPGSSPTWTTISVLKPVIPEVIALTLAAALIFVARWLNPRSARLKVMMSVMLCYGAATVLYLAWLSVAFLHYNTLPSGILLTLTWVGIISILRRAPTEIKEMQELVREQLEKESS